MNKQEAIQAMQEGRVVTHKHFSSDETIKEAPNSTSADYEFEDGCLCSFNEFWQFRDDESWSDGWSVVE